MKLLPALVALFTLASASLASASTTYDVTLRGKPFTLEVYPAANPKAPKGTIIMGSGDAGWIGLGVDLAEDLSKDGYTVVGINVRKYLSMFRTSTTSHLSTDDVPRDYGEIARFLTEQHLLTPPVIVAGVSEGAALGVLAASAPANHKWINGVITLGLPRTAELAWRWADAMSFITKKDCDEPFFEPAKFVAAVAPIPLLMIQSRRDEFVPERDFRMFEQIPSSPKQLVLIDASNHRFTDRRPELASQIRAGLAWLGNPGR
jgi:alpha-beta hydrolase superfamily lysophospholipase